MRILKYTLGVLLCAAGLVLGAALPSLVVQAQDRQTDGVVSYGDINAVSLELTERDPFEPLHLLHTASIEISDEQAKLHREDVLDIFWADLAVLIPSDYWPDQLLKFDLSDSDMSGAAITPMLYYDNNMTSHIFWSIDAWDASNHFLRTIIDDETGNLVTFSFSTHPYENPMSVNMVLLKEEVFPHFSRSYCETLGLPDPDDYYTTYEYHYPDGIVLHLVWQETTYGQVVCELTFSRGGIWFSYSLDSTRASSENLW